MVYFAFKNQKQVLTMGNLENTILDCGFEEQEQTTEIQATKQHIIKSRQAHSAVGALLFIPKHQSITKVSTFPIPHYNKISQNCYQEENIGTCLNQLIESKKSQKMLFPEPQVVSLLESLVYGLAYFSKKKIPHNDFYPTNIFSKEGKFKILNPLALVASSYELTQKRKRFSYLSPQLIAQLLKDTKQSTIPIQVMEKGDIFAIGMIMLQFCTLQSSSECFDAVTFNIRNDVIQERINFCSQKYHPAIRSLLTSMLQLQLRKRISPTDLSYAVHSFLYPQKQSLNVPVQQNRQKKYQQLPLQRINEESGRSSPYFPQKNDQLGESISSFGEMTFRDTRKKQKKEVQIQTEHHRQVPQQIPKLNNGMMHNFLS